MEQANGMMPNGLPAGPNHTMQRPQNGNWGQQVHAKVLEYLKGTLPQFAGSWQSVVDIRERAGKIMQLITMLRAINQSQNIQNCIQIAQNFELRTLQNAQSREQYNEEIQNKMRDITLRRQQQANQMGLPGGMMPSQNNQMPNMLNNMGNMQQPNGLPFQNGGNMGMQPGQMNFGQNAMFNAQLQRPMQPSPLNMQQQHQQQPPQPPQQQQQQPNTMDPSALQLPPRQQNQSQIMQNMGQPNLAQRQNMGQNAHEQPGQPNQQEVIILAKRLYENMTNDQKNGIRQKLLSNMTAEQRSTIKGDPVMKMCVSRAAQQLTKQRQGGGVGAQLNKPDGQNDGTNMQMGNNMPQRPPSQTGGQIDFSNFLGQQANARKLQESGEQVVPASNNAMNMGNQMNMSQSINPAMLANQNGQNRQPNNGAMNQAFFNMQQSMQANERAQRSIMANQHAMASRNQLQGQPGGLHAPSNFNNGQAGQVNSPAMSMLNRPMVPPGQATPNTPQPNRQQPTPNTPMNNAAALSQHHQSMVQNNAQQSQQQQMVPGMSANPTMPELLAKVPPQFREKLSSMSVDQVKQFLWKWSIAQGNRRQGQPGQAGPSSMPNNMTAPQQPGQPMQNQAQQQMANAVPGFNSQPPQNQAPADPAPQRQQEQLRIRNQAMDMAPFPRSVLTNVNMAVPPQLQTWGQLKQLVGRSQGQEAAMRIQQQQIFHFQHDPNALRNAMGNLQAHRQRMVQAAQGNQQGQPQMPGGNIQSAVPPNQAPPSQMAPPAQMVPPAPMMQPPNPGMPQMPNQGLPRMPSIPPPTPQELAAFRSKFPQAQNMTDDVIKSLIIKNKIERLRAYQAQQRQQAGQAAGQPNQAGIIPQANAPNAVQPQRTPQPPLNQQMSGKGAQQKAPSQANNDVIEISSQPAQHPAPPGFQTQVNHPQGQQRQRLPNLTPEQLSRMNETQRAHYIQLKQKEAMQDRQAQAQKSQGLPNGQAGAAMAGPAMAGPAMNAQHDRIRRMLQEVTSANPKGPGIKIDEAGMERAREKLRKLWNPLRQLGSTYPAALAYGFDEQRVRDLMRAKEIVMQNALDETGQIKDYLSVTPEVLHDLERIVTSYMVELKNRKEIMDAQKRRQQDAKQGQPGSGPPPQAPAMAPTTSQQSHTRKASSTSAKAPPAPTDNKTFDWGPRTGDGVPKYDSTRNDLTPDKLKFPPQKKRRTDQANSQASTPAAHVGTPAAATGASPALGKVQSPEQQRKSQAQLKVEAEKEAEKKKFRCKDQACEASLHGFESEDQLKQHEQTQHQALENPLDFLLDSAAKVLGINKDGEASVKANNAQPKAAPVAPTKPRVATIRDLKKEDLTKLETEQVARGTTPVSVKDKIARRQAEFDAAAKAALKDLTLGDAMAQKLNIPLPPEMAHEAAVGGAADLEGFEDPILSTNNTEWAPVTIDDLSQWLEDGWEQIDNDSGIWELRPGLSDSQSSPELTPGSQSSDVNQNDAMKFTISMENFDADLFGDGSRGVPESMIPLYDQIKGMDMQTFGEDATMGGTDDNKDGQSPKKRKADDMWTQPIGDVFDEFFSFPG